MAQIARRLGLAGLMVVAFSLAFATAAPAQMREFSGKVDKISSKKIFVDNRMGDKVAFLKADDVTVEGEKTEWGKIKKNDWVTVSWKFIDKPRKAYKVVVKPPKEDE